MSGHVRNHVQVARRATARRRLTLAAQPDLVAVVDARWDGDAQSSLLRDAALAMAGMAGRGHDLAAALAHVADRHVDHLAEHRLADIAQLA
jgi:hypothetical protein